MIKSYQIFTEIFRALIFQIQLFDTNFRTLSEILVSSVGPRMHLCLKMDPRQGSETGYTLDAKIRTSVLTLFWGRGLANPHSWGLGVVDIPTPAIF